MVDMSNYKSENQTSPETRPEYQDLDSIVRDNLARLKKRAGKTYKELQGDLEGWTPSRWSDSRVKNLFGIGGLRQYKWSEIHLLSDVFGCTILDLVLPEREDSPNFAELARSFGFPPSVLALASRQNGVRALRLEELATNAWWTNAELAKTQEWIDWHAHEDQLYDPRGVRDLMAMAARGNTLRTALWERIGRLDSEARKGIRPDPRDSQTLKDMADYWTEERTDPRTLSPTDERVDPQWILWERVVWFEAASIHEMKQGTSRVS